MLNEWTITDRLFGIRRQVQICTSSKRLSDFEQINNLCVLSFVSGVGSITVVLLIYLNMSYIFVFQNSKVQTGLQRKVFPGSLSLSSFPWEKQVFWISGLSFQRYFMQRNEIYKCSFHLLLLRWQHNIHTILCLAHFHLDGRARQSAHSFPILAWGTPRFP